MHIKQLTNASLRFAALVLVCGTLLASAALAQEEEPEIVDSFGSIVGVVLQSETREPLPYTNVLAYRYEGDAKTPTFWGGTMAITEGRFMIRLAPGRYDLVFRYIGRDLTTLENLVVGPASRLETTVAMAVKPILFEAQPVQARRNTKSEMAALVRQKKSAAVSDAITAEQIKRTTDGDAAAALERVTGVSVVGGKYVFVRGLGDRYSATLLNGASLGSPEPNKRTVPLDIFPTGIFDNIVVQKTFTPDMSGEFGGGVINVSTSDHVDNQSFTQSFSIGMSENAVGTGFLSYPGGGWDFFGFDDGSRAVPGAINDVPGDTSIDRFGLPLEDLVILRKSFANVWTPRSKEAWPNLSYSGTYSNGARIFGADVGLLASITHKNSSNTLEKDEIRFQQDVGNVLYDYDVKDSKVESLGGATVSLGLRAGPNHRMKLNMLYTKGSDDRARISSGFNNDRSVENLERYSLSFVERSLASAVLAGTHEGLLGSSLEWKGSYSQALRDEPDRREVTYEQQDADGPLLLDNRRTPYERIFGESQEDTRSIQLDWKLPLIDREHFATELKLGYSGWERERATGYRRFAFRCLNIFLCGNAEIRSLGPEEVLESEALDQFWAVEETTLDSDSYVGRHGVQAKYAMGDIKLGGRFRMVGGVRWEDSTQKITTWEDDQSSGVKSRPLEESKENSNPLPAMNLTYAARENMNLRLSYSETVNRPELRELTLLKVYNYDSGWLETGNPDLRQAEITSYDARWEWYPGLRQYVALSFFYKDLVRPIEKLVEPDVANYQEKPINGDTGLLRGWEFELRSTLAGLTRIATRSNRELLMENPGLWDRLSLVFNYTKVHSQTSFTLRDGTPRTRPLSGQAEHSVNLGLFYIGRRHESSLLFKDFGRRLAGLSTRTLPEIYEEPPAELDFAYSYRLNDHVKLKAAATNLLDRSVLILQGEEMVQQWKPGRKFSLSFSYSM